jgi:hypothetical protein
MGRWSPLTATVIPPRHFPLLDVTFSATYHRTQAFLRSHDEVYLKEIFALAVNSTALSRRAFSGGAIANERVAGGGVVQRMERVGIQRCAVVRVGLK